MRKEIKKRALMRLKKCYWMMAFLCLILAITGIDYVSSLRIIQTNTQEDIEPSIQKEIFSEIILGHEDESNRRVQDYLANRQNENGSFGIVAVSHSRGVLAQLVNGVSSGQAYQMIYDAIRTITRSKTASIAFFIILSVLFVIFVNAFIISVFKVTAKRVALEFCLYDKVPMSRFLYLLSVRRIRNTALTMLLTQIYTVLWSLTIVGGIIKGYSYYMVPYIIAENPGIPPKKAITLSRRMMHGHKWEAFKLSFSFIGWHILEFFTFGLSGMLFSNPYRELTLAEYYSYVRSAAQKNNIPDADLLNDRYLYQKADKDLLQETYRDLQDSIAEAEEPVIRHTGIRGFFENIFGIALFYDADEIAFQKQKSLLLAVRSYMEICEQNMYPFRLFMARHKERAVKLSPVQYDRHYSVLSLLFMFFTMSFIGWCWEVSLHLISYGSFSNRGFFHGPWLPIYGSGGVLILIILYRFREKIFAEFFSAMVLCGIVEYCSAWYMETTHGGTKWWDYSGYFLNIHGRICAEGLLVFGLGGLAIVYLLAPFLDNLFRRIPKKIAIAAAVLLVTAFTGDLIYSLNHPNEGEGITNIGTETSITETPAAEIPAIETEDM